MSLARAISRGRALKARFAVNGMKKASRSFGTADETELFCAEPDACAMPASLCRPLRPHPEEHREAMRLEGWATRWPSSSFEMRPSGAPQDEDGEGPCTGLSAFADNDKRGGG